MEKNLSRMALGALAVSVCLGCNRSVVHDKQVPDPLVMTKRPVEGKAHITDYRRSNNDIPAPPRPEWSMVTAPSSQTPPVRLLGLQEQQEKGQ